jgi:hypothetical protein
MPTITQLKNNNDSVIRVKTASNSISTDNVADLFDGVVDELHLRGLARVANQAALEALSGADYRFAVWDNVGLFRWTTSAVANGTTIFTAAGGGFWIRIIKHDDGTGGGEGGTSHDVYAEDYGAVGDGVADDSAAWQAAVDAVAPLGGVVNGKHGKTYKFLNPVTLNNVGYDKIFIINCQGCSFLGDNIFVKTIANQTDAAAAVSRTIRIFDGYFYSITTGVGIAVHIRGCVMGTIRGCHFFGYDTGYIFRFGLFSRGEQNRFTHCKNGSIFSFGDWTGATNYNSQSNVSLSYQERAYGPTSNTTGRGISFIACSDSRCEQCTVEGHSFQHGIYFESDASTVVMDFNVHSCHIEATTIYGASIYWRGSGVLYLSNIYQQIPGRLLQTSSIGYPTVRVSRIPYAMNVHTILADSSSTRFMFDQMQSGWTLDNIFDTTNGVTPSVMCHYGEHFIESKGFYFSGGAVSFNSALRITYLVNGTAGAKNTRLIIQPNGHVTTLRITGLWNQRPSLGPENEGHIYFATDLPNQLHVWNGTDWEVVGTSSVDWTAITNKPAFHAVATSGNYLDLNNRPSIGSGWDNPTTLTTNNAVGINFTGFRHIHKIAVHSTLPINLTIGTSSGGNQLGTYAIPQLEVVTIEVDTWAPSAGSINLFYGGISGSGATVKIWHNTALVNFTTT